MGNTLPRLDSSELFEFRKFLFCFSYNRTYYVFIFVSSFDRHENECNDAKTQIIQKQP